MKRKERGREGCNSGGGEGRKTEEVVKLGAGGSPPCTSGKDTGGLCWDLCLGFLGFWETSYLPVVRRLGERMEDKDRANSASRPPFWFLSVPHMIPVNLVQVKKQEELGGGGWGGHPGQLSPACSLHTEQSYTWPDMNPGRFAFSF